MLKGDLHVHTDVSDSSYTIEDTLRMAKEKGLTHIGIVNHDTIRGLKKAIELGEQIGIKVIPGIEISAYDYINNKKVHLLGYNFNLEGKNIRKICDPLLSRRNSNSLKQIETLINNGYDIDMNYIKEKSKNSLVIYKQHIMDALIKAHYTDSIYSELYIRLFKNSGICAGDIEYIDVFGALDAIDKDGGIAVLAHPGQLNSYEILPELINKGLKGIELNHHSHNGKDIKKIREIAKEFGLILTGGTDFHGEYSEKIRDIGSIELPNEYFKFF